MGSDCSEGIGGDLCEKCGEGGVFVYGKGEVASEFISGVVVATARRSLFLHS